MQKISTITLRNLLPNAYLGTEATKIFSDFINILERSNHLVSQSSKHPQLEAPSIEGPINNSLPTPPPLPTPPSPSTLFSSLIYKCILHLTDQVPNFQKIEICSLLIAKINQFQSENLDSNQHCLMEKYLDLVVKISSSQHQNFTAQEEFFGG